MGKTDNLQGQGFTGKVLSAILIIAILGGIGALAYSIAVPAPREKFTEFYILGPAGKAEGYPQKLSVGEEARVLAGVVNHELEDMTYRIEINVNGTRINESFPIALGSEEKWEAELDFAISEPGEKQKVEFVLYKEGEPYSQLYLWVYATE